jgi:hypothetical protein
VEEEDYRRSGRGFGIHMLEHLARKKSIHSRNHIASSIACVKEGKENNIK